MPETMPLWKRYAPQFERWRSAKLNFDGDAVEQITIANGWRFDDNAVELPAEPPGDPLPDGTFEIAKQIILNYEFPDPALVRGIFAPDEALQDRLLILRARFLIFTFFFGVRVVRVIDETWQTETHGQARVWGFSYRTLEGHFEMGEITFEVWKFLDSGRVEFRIHSYSKTSQIRNPLYRLGFRLFGRSLQRRFARTALLRMRQLVIARLALAASTASSATKCTES